MDVDFSRNGADPREKCLFLRPLMTSLNWLKTAGDSDLALPSILDVLWVFWSPSCSL